MKFLIQFKWIISIAIILLVIVGFPYLKIALIPNNELNVWFVEKDPTLEAYEDFSERYGNDRVVILLVYDKHGLFHYEKLNQIQSLTNQLPSIDGVKEVYSLTNVKDLFRIRVNDTIRIKFRSPFSGSITSNPETIDSIKQHIISSSLLADYVVNKDGTSSIIIIELEEFKKIDAKRAEIINKIELIARIELKSESVYLGGLDIITNGINKLSKHDFGLFMGITYLLMFGIILLFFRRWQYVVLAFGAMLVSVMLTFSVYGLMGKQLNIFSLIIPTLIVIMGLINILHIINEFEISSNQNGQIKPKEVIIRESLKKVFKPCLYTALTTMIGFLALLTSSTAVLKEFGLFSALGILIAFLSSFVFSAIVLQFVSLDNDRDNITRWIADKLELLSISVQTNAKIYWAGVLIITIFSIYGISKVKADMLIMGYLPESNEVIQDHNSITKYWGDYFPIDLLVSTNENTNFRNPAMLNALNEFQKDVLCISEIESAFSLVNLVDKVSQVTIKKDINNLLKSPIQTNHLLSRLLDQHEIDYSNFLSGDFKTGRVTLTGPMMSVSRLQKKVDQIKLIGEKHFDGRATLTITSYPALFLKIMKYAVDSMLRSLGLALILIFITLTVMLKSIKLAFIAMIPNLFPIFLMFAFMGLSGINLDLATATVASIALGVAVDDTIHFLAHYQKERMLKHRKLSDAIVNTHIHIGRIIVVSSFILCAGYLVLLLASIKTVVYFGLLTFVAVFGALIGDIVLLPMLLKLLTKKNDNPECNSQKPRPN